MRHPSYHGAYQVIKLPDLQHLYDYMDVSDDNGDDTAGYYGYYLHSFLHFVTPANSEVENHVRLCLWEFIATYTNPTAQRRLPHASQTVTLPTS